MQFHGNRLVGVVLTNIFVHLIICQRLPILCNIITTAVNYKKQASVTGKHSYNMATASLTPFTCIGISKKGQLAAGPKLLAQKLLSFLEFPRSKLQICQETE